MSSFLVKYINILYRGFYLAMWLKNNQSRIVDNHGFFTSCDRYPTIPDEPWCAAACTVLHKRIGKCMPVKDSFWHFSKVAPVPSRLSELFPTLGHINLKYCTSLWLENLPDFYETRSQSCIWEEFKSSRD
jgi:hypothetical protein